MAKMMTKSQIAGHIADKFELTKKTSVSIPNGSVTSTDTSTGAWPGSVWARISVKCSGRRPRSRLFFPACGR